METIKRKRGENWTEDDKETLEDVLNVVDRSIIDSKKNDTTTNLKKVAEWKKVAKIYQDLSGKARGVSELKNFWKRKKINDKKKKLLEKKSVTNDSDKPPEGLILENQEITIDGTTSAEMISSHEASLEDMNIDVHERANRLLKEEYALKLQYQRQELSHQEQKHKLEIEILLLEKEKKHIELKLLKEKLLSSCNKIL